MVKKVRVYNEVISEVISRRPRIKSKSTALSPIFAFIVCPFLAYQCLFNLMPLVFYFSQILSSIVFFSSLFFLAIPFLKAIFILKDNIAYLFRFRFDRRVIIT